MHRLLVPLALAVSMVAAVAGQEPPPGSALSSLVETERAFSRLSVAEGTSHPPQ